MKSFRYVFLGLCCVATGVLSAWVVTEREPEAPLQCVARAATSDRVDGYLTCTGFVDSGIEAVYVLDSTTGMLSVGVLSRNGRAFQARYSGNVVVDLERAITAINKTAADASPKRPSSRRKKGDIEIPQGAIAIPTEPKFIMACGTHDMISSGTLRPSASALYVTEVNTGLIMVYVLPWNATAHSSGTPFASPITYYAVDRFLIPMVTEEVISEE